MIFLATENELSNGYFLFELIFFEKSSHYIIQITHKVAL